MYGNDPNDASGIRRVLLAEHSSGKPEMMASAAFPDLRQEEVKQFINMEASNVFCVKKGGMKHQAIADAKITCQRLVELADVHGTKLRVWGCGGGMDRIVQISSLDGFVQPDNMRPLNHGPSPLAEWKSLGIRPSHTVTNNRCKSINLTSSANGTGTYRVEIWRNNAYVTHFFLGVYPHPGSLSWGAV